MHEVFETARAHTPCVLFFDEIDALAANRSDFRAGTGRSLVNQFLAELDGVATSNDGILVLGATNAPWHLDPAFRRPGRFDDVLFVPPPDAQPAPRSSASCSVTGPSAESISTPSSRSPKGFSGADLRGIVEAAVRRKLERSIRDGASGRSRPATSRPRRRDRPDDPGVVPTAKNYVTYANQSGLYDPVRPYLR